VALVDNLVRIDGEVPEHIRRHENTPAVDEGDRIGPKVSAEESGTNTLQDWAHAA